VSHPHRIALIPGDGIGPEVLDAAIPAIAAAAEVSGGALAFESLPFGADHYLSTGETLPDEAFRHLRDETDAILLGGLGDPRVPGNEHARDILLGLRFRLDLYVNYRPLKLLHPDLCPLRGDEDRHIDLVIFRENTEGIYLGRGRGRNEGTPDEEQIAEEVHTAPRISRILEAAFDWAVQHGRTCITMSDKSNAVPAHRLWLRLFDEVGARFPTIQREHRYVDALAMELVREPERFQVIVANNLLGDILSDLGAELVGGMGMAPSANLHPGRPGLFEPVHGSAPALTGQGKANPMAAVLSGALLLDTLGLRDGARLLETAVSDALRKGVRTSDIGGTATTAAVGQWLHERVRAA
jgi:3-isopropylmalate dehydrogenase